MAARPRAKFRTAQFVRMFGCDVARIINACGNLFLVLGWRKWSEGEWFNQHGRPVNFHYTEEKTVASGHNMRELVASAREYKRLLQEEARERGPEPRRKRGR
jgi:hypothetical protein